MKGTDFLSIMELGAIEAIRMDEQINVIDLVERARAAEQGGGG